MSFLTSRPDLTNTIFEENDLEKTRKYLLSGITKHKPSWLKKPQGPLGDYWKREDVQSACNLIDFAQMIDIVGQNITQQSVPRLSAKITDLLRNPSDLQQFHETLTELQVAYGLVTYVSPLMLEPEISGQKRSPDMVFRLPEDEVYLDVTVFRGGPLEKWEQAKEKVRNAVERKIIKRKKALLVEIQLPFEYIPSDQIIKQVLEEIDNSVTGELTIGNKGMIKWEPFPITKVEDLFAIPEMSTNGGAFYKGNVTVDIAFGSQTNIAAPSVEDIKKANELLFRSVRNKLKEKHDQFPPDQLSLYVIKIGHWRLPIDRLLTLIRNEIWPRDDFRWITGIIFYIPREGYLKTDKGAQLLLDINPRAKCQATDSLKSIFRDGRQFHY